MIEFWRLDRSFGLIYEKMLKESFWIYDEFESEARPLETLNSSRQGLSVQLVNTMVPYTTRIVSVMVSLMVLLVVLLMVSLAVVLGMSLVMIFYWS